MTSVSPAVSAVPVARRLRARRDDWLVAQLASLALEIGLPTVVTEATRPGATEAT